MSKRIAVIISEDPRTTARPVEALRIALGLYAGDHKLTVILLGQASLLLKEDLEDITDAEILETYLPSFKHLSIPFVIEEGTVLDVGMKGFSVTTLPADEIRHFVRSVDRSLIF